MTPPIDRRRFLAAGGTGLTLPWLIGCAGTPKPEPKEPAEEPIPPSEQITLAVVGTGIRARNMFRRYFAKNRRVRLLAACDVDKKRLEHFKGLVDAAKGDRDCKAYVDYREVLSRADIDAVLIATPDHWHATQVVDACKAGKDVYCEKPLTHTLHEGRVIMDAVAKHGRVFQTGSQQRTEFGRRFVQAVELVRAGRIGKLLEAWVGVGDPARKCDLGGEEPEPGLDWDRWLGPTPKRDYHSELSPRGVHKHYPRWRRYWDFCGGMLADMGAHHFDIVQWALDADSGGPVAALPPPEKGAKRGAALLYANGVKVTHGGAGGATFLGTKGMIHVDRGRLYAAPQRIAKRPLGDNDLKLPRHDNHVADWLRCIKTRETPICSAEVGARSAAVCQLVNLAYRHHRKITWDPVRWRFAGDEPSEWLDYERRAEYALPDA